MKPATYLARPGFLPLAPLAGKRAHPGLGSMPRVNGGISRAACAQARSAGVELSELLKKANLTIEQISQPQTPIAARDQVNLLNVLAEACSDELLGFHVSQTIELRDAALLFYVLASSDTLLDALRRVARYSSLVNEGVVQRCAVGATIDITLSYSGISRHLDRHQAECWMALLMRILRHLSKRNIHAAHVHFVHARIKQSRELNSYFGGAVEFGADLDQISFPLSVGDIAVASADTYLNKLLVHYCEEALTHRPRSRGSFRTQVENALVPRLPHAEFRASDIARELGVSQRTLARRLSEEGVSFTALLDELRLDLANRYLAEDIAPVSQIAWLLGYQQVSAFSKAYRRWTGHSPRAARTSAVKQRREASER
jgi:AraC-like DNA-binding protein